MSDEFTFNMNDEEFAVDFSEAVEFKVFDAGWQQVEVIHLEKRMGTDREGSPLPQIALRLRVTSGEYEGQNLFVNWPLKGRGSGITKQGLTVALGSTPESGASFNFADLMGARFEVFVRPNIWKVEDGGDGELRNRVQRYRALTEAAVQF